MSYLFYPPQVMEGQPGVRDSLFRRIRYARGVAVLIKNGVAERWRVVIDDDVADYDYVYLGGHVHAVAPEAASVLLGLGFPVLTQAEADALVDSDHDGFLIEV